MVSLRDKIAREMLVNTLIHREYSSSYIAKFMIEEDKMYIENACRALKEGEITPENMEPSPKNPIIASFFNQIGNADELGSGTRNLYKYSRRYSGEDPKILESDIFKIAGRQPIIGSCPFRLYSYFFQKNRRKYKKIKR